MFKRETGRSLDAQTSTERVLTTRELSSALKEMVAISRVDVLLTYDLGYSLGGNVMKVWRSWIGEAALRLSGPEADALERAIILALDRDDGQRTLSVDERSTLSTILTLLSRNRP